MSLFIHLPYQYLRESASATFSSLVKLILGFEFENSWIKLPISAQNSFVLLFARAATYRNFFETFIKGLFLASSRRVLSLIDFKPGFGNPVTSPLVFLSGDSPLYLSSFCVTELHIPLIRGRERERDSTLRDLICLHVVQFVNISRQIYHCPKWEEIDFARYHNSRWSRVSRDC